GPGARGHRCAAPPSVGRKACLVGKAGKHYCRSRRITPSVEKWRHEHPHDSPPYPCVPSPTSAISSSCKSCIDCCRWQALNGFGQQIICGDGTIITTNSGAHLDNGADCFKTKGHAISNRSAKRIYN